VKIMLGNTCIEMYSQDADFMEEMHTRYHPFLTSRQPDFCIEFSLRNDLTVSEIKELLRNSRSYLEGSHFFTLPRILDCQVDWKEARLQVSTEKKLFSQEVDYKLMNILLRGIYSGIHKRQKNERPEAYLVHGCGIMDGTRCYLFTGPSGSGKTTVASLADGRQVLNDETVLIGRSKEGFELAGTPFDGGVPARCGGAWCLSAILFLKHEKEVSLRRLSKVETYYRFLAQVFGTTPLFEIHGSESVAERSDLSAEVARQVPSYELGFRPDSSFWKVVENI